MDDRNAHDDDDQTDIDDEQDGTVKDDESAPADTDKQSDEPKKADAEEVKASQKKAWLEKIRSGKVKLDDMPDNLAWLKRDIREELEPKPDETKAKIREVIAEERAEEEFDFLVEDLKASEISGEQDAQLREEYENLLGDDKHPTSAQKLRALTYAKRLVGLKDTAEISKERRRKGMSLPPFGGKRRSVVDKDKTTEIEKRLGGNLPPGFKA